MSLVLMRKVLRDLFARKASLLALVCMMGFGIAGLVGFWSVSRDLERARDEYFRAYRMGDFYATLKRAPMWMVDQVRDLPNVRDARGRVSLGILLDVPNLAEPVSGTALSLPERPVPIMNDVMLMRGQWFSGRGASEVLLNDAFAEANGLGPGSRIKAMLLDKQHDLLVVGTVSSPEFVYLISPGSGLAPDPRRFGVIYLEETFLQEAGDLSGACNEIIGTLHDNAAGARRATLDRVKELLDSYGASDANAMDQKISTQFLNNELENIRKSTFITPVVFLSVSALVLNVLLARLVQQQRMVIGTLKAIGYSAWQVSAHFACYGLSIGLIGGIAGSAVSFGVHHGIIRLYRVIFELPNIAANFYPGLYLIGFAVSCLSALAGTAKGVRAAVKLQPAEAMHPPPPERTGHTPMERFPWLWRRLTFRWKMVFRSIFRNPFRSAVSLVAGTVATMMVLAAFCMRDGLYKLVQHELSDMSRQDATVTLRDPRGIGFDAEERQMVAQTEPQLRVAADLFDGAREKRVSITGIAPGNRLFTPLDAEGRPIRMPESGLVLSRKLAEVLGVAPGDDVMVQTLIGERRKTAARVAALVDTYTGLSAYADIRYLSRLVGEEWAANALLVRQDGGASLHGFTQHLRELPSVIGLGWRLQQVRNFEETFAKANLIIIWVFVIFAMLIGFGSVLNASLVSMSERVREIGTLRTLGFTSPQIAFIFAAESSVFFALGTPLGLWLGHYYVAALSVAYSSELFRFPAVVLGWRLWLTAGLMLGTTLAAQWIVYRLIAKLDWLEALKVKE